jgi:ABC-type uncharacterized transport system involved in gliding motility auxiliary subunit
MNLGWLKKRQAKYTAYASAYIVVVLAVLGAINFLANRHNKSWDSTSNKQFSLSDQTRKVVRNLDRDVKITYFDETMRFPQARDLLDRYDTLSTRLTVEYIDPVRRPQVAREAGFRRDAPILVAAGDRQEEARSLNEEDVTGALIRALKTGERVACFVSGSGEHGIDDAGRNGYSSLKEALERSNYQTRTISLLAAGADGKPEVPGGCTLLVVGGPRHSYPQPAVDAIRAYVENGGSALVMMGPPLSLGGGDEVSPNPELAKLLESWGVVPQRDLALDTSGIGGIFGLGPEVPLVTNYDTHAIVRDMREVATAFPLSRTLEVASGEKTSVERLFSTSDNSYATNKLASAQIRIDTKSDRKGPLTLAAAGTHQGDKEGRFVVVGSSLWAANGYLRFNGNRDLMLNMVNWLTADEDLISIRPREARDQRLDLTSQKMSIVFWFSVVFLPLGVIASGIVTWWRRR